jgi:hypothetical protein
MSRALNTGHVRSNEAGYNTAILIAGHNTHPTLSTNPIDVLTAHAPYVITVGDRVIGLNDTKLSQLSRIQQEQPSMFGDKVLVYIDMHGFVDVNHRHGLSTLKNSTMLTADLFDALSATFSTPIDVILQSCYGKAALADLNHLPLGSRVMMFPEQDKSSFAVTNAVAEAALMDKEELTFEGYFNQYLVKLGHSEMPIFATVGGPVIDPYASSATHVGKTIEPEARHHVHQTFGQDICAGDEECHNRLDRVMDQMEQAQSAEEFHVIQPAIANLFSAATKELELRAENYTSEDTSPVFASEFKKSLDRAFIDHQLPLELNLERLLRDEEEDEDESFEEITAMLYEIGSMAMLSNLYQAARENSIFTTNHLFPTPEYNYGRVLGISLALDQFALAEIEQ